MITYTNTVEPAEHIALVKGDLRGPEPVLVRVHVFNIVEDVLEGAADSGGHRRRSGISERHRGIRMAAEPRLRHRSGIA